MECPIQKTTILAQIPHGDLLNSRLDGFQGILGQGLEILLRLLAEKNKDFTGENREFTHKKLDFIYFINKMRGFTFR